MLCVNLSRLRYPVPYPNTSLGVAMKTLFRWDWHLNQLILRKQLTLHNVDGLHPIRSPKGKDWGSGKGGSSASRQPSDSRLLHQGLPVSPAIWPTGFEPASSHSCVSQFLKMHISIINQSIDHIGSVPLGDPNTNYFRVKQYCNVYGHFLPYQRQPPQDYLNSLCVKLILLPMVATSNLCDFKYLNTDQLMPDLEAIS